MLCSCVLQGGGFIAAVVDGLRWYAGAVQLRLLSGSFVMAAYNLPGPAVGILVSHCQPGHGVQTQRLYMAFARIESCG